MSSTANAKCVTRDGKLAFIAEGDVLLFCSSNTCGPNGKAEFGCEDCCGWPYGSTSIPTGKYIKYTCNHIPVRQSDLVNRVR